MLGRLSLILACFVLLFFHVNRDSQEKFLDSEYITSPPLSKIFSSPTVDSSSKMFSHNEDELLADSSTTKPLSEGETPADFPVHKISQEKHEAPLHLDGSFKKIAKDKIFDNSLETSSFKIFNKESNENVAPKMISRQRSEVSMDVALRKGVSLDFDMDVSLTKTGKDSTEELEDVPSRKMYKERHDIDLLEMKKNSSAGVRNTNRNP